MPPWFCLTLHARYQCRHAGACCQDWTVHAEPEVIAFVEARQIRRAGVSGPLFVATSKNNQDTWSIATEVDGSCVFFDQGGGRLCEIHRTAGADALPSACRHFPRKILRDARGTFVSLSHFCPTAALMLLGVDPLLLVEAEPPLRLNEPIEGLDAVNALPPLVRPGLLCDLEGYTAWERAGLETLARPDLTYRQALNLIAAATETVREWRPGTCSMIEHVERAFRRIPAGSARAQPDAHTRAIETVMTLCAGRVPDDIMRDKFIQIGGFEPLWTQHAAGPFQRFDRAMKNYLAARLFANWIAYQGRGLRSSIEWLQTAAALVRHQFLRRVLATAAPPGPDDFIEAVRMADLLLLHVVDSRAFASHVAPIEGHNPK